MFTRKHTHQQQFHAFKDISHSYKASYMQKSSSYHTHTPSEMRTHTSPFRVPKSIKNHNPDTLCPNIRCSYDLKKIMLNWQSRCHCDCFNFIEKVEKPTKRVSWQFACWQSICSNLQSGKKMTPSLQRLPIVGWIIHFAGDPECSESLCTISKMARGVRFSRLWPNGSSLSKPAQSNLKTNRCIVHEMENKPLCQLVVSKSMDWTKYPTRKSPRWKLTNTISTKIAVFGDNYLLNCGE